MTLPLTHPADPFGLLADDGEHSRVAWCHRDGGKYLVISARPVIGGAINLAIQLGLQSSSNRCKKLFT